jgi:inhibitor of cysteine peptidase
MRKLAILGLVAIMLLPLFITGCASSTTTNTEPWTQTIEITLDEFNAQNHVLRNIDMAAYGGTLTVKLGSNPSTGYSWTDAEITDPTAIRQISRDYVAPDTGLVGAGGTEVWVFNTSNPSTTTITMSYGQPWAGGAKDIYTLTIVIHVIIYLGGPVDQ